MCINNVFACGSGVEVVSVNLDEKSRETPIKRRPDYCSGCGYLSRSIASGLMDEDEASRYHLAVCLGNPQSCELNLSEGVRE
jgi:hypothetical protein